ncbi:MAG: winged helix-turn-helix transcriptional regulator [Cytophagales bacterium]|nr:winged helix-turn-helix transcriptional regulator [Cytophagales bacterium]
MPHPSEQGAAFAPRRQAGSPAGKIVAALERISQAFRVLLWQQAGSAGLSPIQVQLLLFIRFHLPRYCTVSYLAREFGLTKATVSDSVKVLAARGFVSRQAQPGDGRSRILALTETGSELAEKASDFAPPLSGPVRTLPVPHQEALLQNLLTVIGGLTQTGIIRAPRMCFSCRFPSRDAGRYHCRLLGEEHLPAQLRLDCAEHQEKANN